MGYELSKEQFDQFLDRLKSAYCVFGPVVDVDRGSFADTDRITYKEVQRFDDLELNRKSYFSPKEVFYPIRETLFHFSGSKIAVPPIDAKKTAILLRPCDINGIDRLDTIFLANGPDEDFYYKRRRDKVRFFMIECATGFESCWCTAMDANETNHYDVAFRFGDKILADVKNEEFAPYFAEYAQQPFAVQFVRENLRQVPVRVPEVGDITADLFAHELWDEYTARCIGCGRCNIACITCSCFTMQDVAFGTGRQMGERRRCWAGCHIDGFTVMAGGQRFREQNGDKMRFKAMHKVNDFHRRFGKHQCVGCGRCEDVCPQYISFARCINTLSQVIEERKS
jgi:anaerobic sulfite reductase subunit A